MASKLYINEIVSRNGLYTLANTATFDANNHVSMNGNTVSLTYQSESNALSISQSGSGNAGCCRKGPTAQAITTCHLSRTPATRDRCSARAQLRIMRWVISKKYPSAMPAL